MTAAVRVLSWRGRWGEALASEVSAPFTASTGLSVEAVPHVGLRLPAGLLAALASGAEPPVDVVWCNGPPALRADRAGYAEPLAVEGLRARATEPGAPGVVFPYATPYVLVHPREAPAPRSWEALWDPAHRGRVAVYPGGNGLTPVAQVLGGGRVADIPTDMAPCWRRVATLRGQIGASAYSVGLEARLRSGELDLLFRALPNALGFAEAGVPVGVAAPEGGVPDALDALWVPRGLPPDRRRAALAYVAHALTRPVQARWASAMGVFPMHPDAPTPELLRRPGLPAHAEDYGALLHVPEPVKAAHEEEWERAFDRLAGAP